ncbi:MAG: rod shape-determining protein MreC, partial [Patescibacteria group bacterium]
DKKIKRKKIFQIALGVVVLIILFYFRSGIFNGLSRVSQGLFRPVLILGNSVGEKFKSLNSFFISKNSLYLQNQSLQSQLNEDKAKISNYDSVVAENTSLKEILGRKNRKTNMILAVILSKPNQSIYDTLVIDAGAKEGVKIGNMVFALGNVPIGRVDTAYNNSSKVILFSNAGERTQAVVSGKNIFIELVGRGGGNFEMIMPKDFILQKGDQVVLPGINPYILAIVETIISDSRNPFTKALLSSPVNIQELKFVEVEQ